MNVVIHYGFEAITFKSSRQSLVNKGKQLHEAGHVIDVCEKKFGGTSSLITGQVIRQTSINALPYKVEIKVRALFIL